MSSATTIELNSPYTAGNDFISAAGPLMNFIREESIQNSAYDAAQARELRDWQEQQNKIAMDFSAEQAAINRDWQKMMSDTAHQREVADMIRAGINPVLSVMGGNGATVTSGATASGVTSSGAMSQSDKSFAGSMSNLFGSFISALMQQQSSLVSAVTNMATTEKNNQTSKEIAEGYMAIDRYVADISRLNTMTSTEASKYCTELSAKASEFAAVTHGNAQIAAANLAKSASMYATDQNNANKIQLQEDAQEFEEYMTKFYPSNLFETTGSLGMKLGDLLKLFGSDYNPFNERPFKNGTFSRD